MAGFSVIMWVVQGEGYSWIRWEVEWAVGKMEVMNNIKVRR